MRPHRNTAPGLRLLAAALATVLVTHATPARADDTLLADPLYELSAFYLQSPARIPGRAPMTATGIHFGERHGILGGGILAAALGPFAMLGANQKYRHVDTIHGTDYDILVYEEKSDAELRAEREAAEGFVGWLYHGDHIVEIDAYLPVPGQDGARGGRVSLYLLSIGTHRVFELGLRLGVAYQDLDGITHRAVEVGVPARLAFTAGRRLSFDVEMLLGGLFIADLDTMATPETPAPSGGGAVPISAGVTLSPADRVFLRAAAGTSLITEERAVGFTVELGGRL